MVEEPWPDEELPKSKVEAMIQLMASLWWICWFSNRALLRQHQINQQTFVIDARTTCFICRLQFLQQRERTHYSEERSIGAWINELGQLHNILANSQSRKRWVVDSSDLPHKLQTEMMMQPRFLKFSSVGTLSCKIHHKRKEREGGMWACHNTLNTRLELGEGRRWIKASLKQREPEVVECQTRWSSSGMMGMRTYLMAAMRYGCLVNKIWVKTHSLCQIKSPTLAVNWLSSARGKRRFATAGWSNQISLQKWIFSPLPSCHEEFSRMVGKWRFKPSQMEDLL